MFEILMKQYIDEQLHINIRPSFGIGSYPIVTYTHSPITNGHLKQSQYEIKICHDDFDEALLLRDQILNLLSSKEDSKATYYKNLTFTSELSGGGQLFNDSIQSWELSLIFIIRWRLKA